MPLPAACLDDRPASGKGPTRMSLARPEARKEADDPGGVLRHAREAHGLSLADLSRVTKISLPQLKAIEANNFDQLPSEVYARGFLRAYAREVDLDPEETIQRYFAHVHAHQDLFAVTSPPSAVTGGWRTVGGGRRIIGGIQSVAHDKGNDNGSHSPSLPLGQWFLVGLAGIGLATYLMFGRTAAAPPKGPVTEGPAASADATPAVGAEVAGGVAQASVGDLTLPTVWQIEFSTQGPCWLAANADGENVLTKLLQAGDRRTIDVREELLLRVGEPGALSFSINGRAGRPLGRPGEPVTVRITRDNYREFLASAS
jgi:hypothetical protein